MLSSPMELFSAPAHRLAYPSAAVAEEIEHEELPQSIVLSQARFQQKWGICQDTAFIELLLPQQMSHLTRCLFAPS